MCRVGRRSLLALLTSAVFVTYCCFGSGTVWYLHMYKLQQNRRCKLRPEMGAIILCGKKMHYNDIPVPEMQLKSKQSTGIDRYFQDEVLTMLWISVRILLFLHMQDNLEFSMLAFTFLYCQVPTSFTLRACGSYSLSLHRSVGEGDLQG